MVGSIEASEFRLKCKLSVESQYTFHTKGCLVVSLPKLSKNLSSEFERARRVLLSGDSSENIFDDMLCRRSSRTFISPVVF